MSTFTFRVSSSATNAAATAYGQQPDLGAPSYFDLVITNSSDPLIPNGTYDAYCLNPIQSIVVTRNYSADNYAGNATASYVPIGFGAMSQVQVDQINWVLAQNFTSDSKYVDQSGARQFNFGEVQNAIWKIVGFTDAQVATTSQEFLTDNSRHVVNASDVDFILSASLAAVTSGHGVLPTDAFFSTIIDPAGNVQPLIVQLQSAKLGNFVWLDANADGVQSIGEAGVDNVVVELYNSSGVKVASTLTGDDFSTVAVEHGFYQFAGLQAGAYQVKFVAPTYAFTAHDANGNTQDTIDSDADVLTGFSQIVNLAVGESNQTIDAGLVAVPPAPATLSGYVYEDFGNDGVRGAGEPVIGGVTVTLTGVDTLGNPVTATTVTNAQGFYEFTGLAAGTYGVAETQPGAYLDGKDTAGSNGGSVAVNDVISGVVLVAGDNSQNNNFGELVGAQIRGFVYCDDNNDGIKQGTEVGLGNVTINLTGTDDLGAPVTASTVTAADGSYAFLGLRPGSYTVTEPVQPAGKLDGIDTAGFPGNGTAGNEIISNIVLTQGLISNDNNFGEILPAKISGYVYLDAGNDGVRNAEPAIAGVTITLSGTDDRGNLVNATTTTNALGFYEFTGLRPGTYTSAETQPADYLDGKDTAGSTGGSAAANDVISGIVLVAGANSVENNFGELPLPNAHIGDFVWEDKNANGVQDAGEAGIGGVTVTLCDAAGNPIATTTTNAAGGYGFDVAPGTYSVAVTAPGGYFVAPKDAGGNDATDSDINGAGKTGSYTLASGEVNNTVDAGLYRQARLGDRVWLDANGNGQQDAGEANVAGVTVNLLDAGGNVVATQTTNASGNYLFTGLTPGAYSVQFVAPAGYQLTTKDAGADASDSDADTATGKTGQYVLQSGDSNLTVDAGLVQKAHLGDFVWEDKNANGVQDAGEAGIANVVVNLKDAAGTVVGTTTTNAAGGYGFDVLPGTYSVQVVSPTGYTVTARDAGGNDAADSDIGATGATGTYTVASGDNNLTIDAGYYRTASIGDKVWLDCNGNGVQDAGELGVANVTVKLLDAGGAVLATQTTDVNGNYLFSGLTPGSYAVQFGTLSGYSFTTRDAGGNDATDSDAATTTGKTIYTTLDSGEVDRTWDAGLAPVCRPVTFCFTGNSYTDGTNGNSRSYADALTGVSVTARAFSQDKGTNNWQAAFLGAYGGGLGVTDSSEGDGSGNAHTIDNVGRNNYIVLQFSQDVKLDMAYLGYVVGDSDMQVWIGNSAATITTMNNGVLASMGFSEVNTTTLTTARWADLNAGGITGNVIIIAADTTDTTPEDYFKLQQLAVCAPDYCAPVAKASIGNFVWEDRNFNGVQDAGEAGIANVTVKLLNSAGTALATTSTDSAGGYSFGNLNPADYKVQVVAPSGYFVTKKDQGGNDAADSDIDSSGTTVLTTLVAGENDLTWDAGLYRKACVGDKVWEDKNHNNIQDVGEPGIGNITVKLMDASGSTVLATTTTNSAGNYQFSNLDPGSYVLLFDKTNVSYAGYNMSNWKWAVKDYGSNDAVDSDVAGNATATTNVTKTDAFTLTSGQSDQTRDAGITPIVIDLDGNGIHTLSRAADTSAGFDLFGNGSAVKSGWISGSDGFLAIDRNGNGKVDSINELFGGTAKGAGFANLANFDANGDGLVNSLDAHFGQLMVWRDANSNHATDAGELISLAQAGVTSLTVAYTELPFIDAQDNLHLERSTATLAGGAEVSMTDVYFNVAATDATAAGIKLPTMADLLGDDRALDTVLGGAGMASTCQVRLADETCHANGGDAGELMRRLTALTREDHHAAVV